MKNLIITLCFVLLNMEINAQTCGAGGITFSTQAQIDNFTTDYPGCTQILGGVTISGAGITNLNGLSVITSIGEDLEIINNPALTNLTGLDALNFIGEDLYIYDNSALTSLTGLNGISSIQGFLWIIDNSALTSLTGLNAVTSIDGFLQISNNSTLTSLSGLEMVSSIGGYLFINNNDALSSLNVLGNVITIGGYLQIDNNDALTSLAGLDELVSIGGYLGIINNPALTSLSGLETLTSIGEYISIYNSPLESLLGLTGLTSIGGGLDIVNTAVTSLSGLENIDFTSITDLNIYGSNMLSFCEVQSICDYLAIPSNPAIITANAPGCATRAEVEAACLALPIELISFICKNIENRMILYWQTASEQNNDYFQIEHNQDGKTFNLVGTVNSRGNSTELQSYTFTHENPPKGDNYYRLKQVDFDGKNEYSNTINIKIENHEVSISPNPTTGILEIQGEDSNERTLRLTDNLGRLLIQQRLSEAKQIDISNLPNGMYIIEILNDRKLCIKRVIKG